MLRFPTLELIFIGLTVFCEAKILPKTTDPPPTTPARVDAAPGEFPYVVSLRRNGVHFCGGAIIGSKHVLTAAHCFVGRVDPPYTAGLTVATGALKRQDDGDLYLAKKVVPHSGFSRGPDTRWKHDIAVITIIPVCSFQLMNPIIMTQNVKTLGLPTSPTPGAVVAVLSGWGSATKFGPEADHLQKRNVTVLTNDECNKKDASILDTQMCGFDGRGTGFCNGDSGSPLVYNNEVVGIVSFAISCGIGYPDTYTRVHKYLDFIKENSN
ncbi:chymotrypsin-2 isoform X1 [Diachasma alloeum]|uniref:chymotrypsin-2 isoform X1 n=1 Tax=Diachasma alloeum TaxID=454923 RepID=UPI000738382E|nr:chymotrypsin-2 isoform X1 [Diachasma alloeum]